MKYTHFDCFGHHSAIFDEKYAQNHIEATTLCAFLIKGETINNPFVLIEQFKAMGADAVPISFSEVYNALKQGTIDGQENPLVSITKMKFYEVQSHMTLSYHGYLAYAFLFSKMLWDELEPEQQTILKEVAIGAARDERELTAKMEDGFLQTISASGTEVIRLTEEERKVFEAATRVVHEKFADSIGQDTLEMIYSKIQERAK